METRNLDTDGERRQVTVLFADISGFTSLGGRMDPEEVASPMNRCFALMESAVVNNGGTVIRFVGDCVLAVFGVPAALEDAPRNAVNSAIEMRRTVQELFAQTRLPVPLDIHTGINTGLVVTGDVGGAAKRAFDVMGDAVNVASRLKDAAPKGAIWVGAETHRYTTGDFEFRKLAPQKLKGKDPPFAAYEVLSFTGRRHRAKPVPAASITSLTLVGRDRQLRQLRDCVQHLLEGRGGVVNLTGEAGMGKSRLLAELAAQEELRALTLLEGRSLAIGQRLAFHTFADLLRQWAGILDDDDDQAALDRLAWAVMKLVGDE